MTFTRALSLACTLAVLASCKTPSIAPTSDAGKTGTSRTDALTAKAIMLAENRRAAKDLETADGVPDDPASRRAIARAHARIADEARSATLLRYLSDEDDEVVAWAAYGLGYACKMHADRNVKALVARAATWIPAPSLATASRLDAAFAIARAIGRCATPAGEKSLATMIEKRTPFAHAATYALGDVLARRAPLADESLTALLEAAAPAHGEPPLDGALFPFSRITNVPEAFRARLLEVCQKVLAKPGDGRIFAVRALGKLGASGPPTAATAGAEDLLRTVVLDRSLAIAERAEAARALGAWGDRGLRVAGDALVKLVQGGAAAVVPTAETHVIGTLLDTLRETKREPPSAPELSKTLYALAALAVPADASLARRTYDLRCRAAGALARGEIGSEVLRACAPEGNEALDRAVLRAVLANATLNAARKAELVRLARKASVRVREAALEGAGAHPELGAALVPIVAEALTSKQVGLVATAADLVHAHPTRFLGDEKRGIVPELATAFDAALIEPWPEDAVETRAALLDAAVALAHTRAKEIARAACGDPNVTMRQRGQKALGALGEDASKCIARDVNPAKELDAPTSKTTRIGFDVAGNALAITLDPGVAPVTTTRLVALARSGFFRGVVVHRVVPGFVVQLGDPGGDGYGGSGQSLRCETSPIPFQPLDVGMALAGRDTGSSQFFVTLSRTPHLDGDYTWVGRATGDWQKIVEGETVGDVSVTE